MPIYKKTTSKRLRTGTRAQGWQVVIHIHGQRKEFLFRGTKAEAEAFEARKRVELEVTPPDAMRVVPKLSVFCATRCRPHAELRLRPTTWYKQQFLLAEIMAALGDLKLNELGSSAVVDGYARQRLAAGLKIVSVNNELRVLRRVLNFARERGVPIPPPKLKLLRDPGAGRVKVWTHEEVNRLLAACVEHSPSVLALVAFLLNTGCRKGEVIPLTWDHVEDVTLVPEETLSGTLSEKTKGLRCDA